MAQALGVRYAFLTECADRKHTRFLAVWMGNRFGKDFEYDVAGTPCERVLEGEVCRFGKEITGLSNETLEILSGYDWPGNIRELQNIIERTVVLSDSPVLKLGPGLLPVAKAGRPHPPQKKRL